MRFYSTATYFVDGCYKSMHITNSSTILLMNNTLLMNIAAVTSHCTLKATSIVKLRALESCEAISFDFSAV